jgi:predicted DNA-binding transcriptional regulator AlpA
MAKRALGQPPLAPVDLAQRYTIAEAISYLRTSRASIYRTINSRRILVIKEGKRTFVPGSEIARLSRLESEANARATPDINVLATPKLKGNSTQRLLDSRIQQALMKDIARQQALWELFEKFDAKLQCLVTLMETLVQKAPPEATQRREPFDAPHFLRLKEVTARVGLRVTSIYRYIALGAFPKPRKFGRSSLWVTTEVNDWIAQRMAGMPVEISANPSGS